MIWSILFIIGALYVGYKFGRNAEKDISFKNDPDNDVNTEDGSLQLLLFTKKERYKLGRAMVLGNKKEIEEAKKDLENAASRVREIAYESKR